MKTPLNKLFLFLGDNEESSDDLQEFSTPTELSEVPVPPTTTEEKKPEVKKQPEPPKQQQSLETSKTAESAKQVTVVKQVTSETVVSNGLQKEIKSVAKSEQSVVSVEKQQTSAVEKLRAVEKTESDTQVENFSVGVEVNVAVDDMSRRYSSGISSSRGG